MLGSAVGDAIGEIILYRAGRGFVSIDDLSLMIDRSTLLRDISTFPELQYTDDTHMAIGIAEALSKSRTLELNEIKRRFLANYQAEPGRGYGLGPSAILSFVTFGRMAYDEAVKYVNSKYTDGSRGNGAVMRTHPVGLRYHDTPNLSNIASNIAGLTHTHPVAQDAAVILSHGIAYLLRTGNRVFSRSGFLKHLSRVACTTTMQDKLVLLRATTEDQTEPDRAIVKLGCGCEAHTSLPFALYAFLRHPDSFEECIMTAVLTGGDTDTLGAMAGALCGTRVGIHHIPQDWIRKLENRAYISKLARRLYRVHRQSVRVMELSNER